MRIARILIATVALVALSSPPAMADDAPAPADGSSAQSPELRAQAEANGLSGDQARSLQAAGPHGCNRFQFCIYKKANFNGVVARVESCVLHDVRGRNLVSYVNNQTAGTVARFYSSEGILLFRSRPAPDKGPIPFDVNIHTAYVRPC
jgi:hypothetical protein